MHVERGIKTRQRIAGHAGLGKLCHWLANRNGEFEPVVDIRWHVGQRDILRTAHVVPDFCAGLGTPVLY